MYLTILKLLSPYLQRYAAKKTAAYLQARRERRLGPPHKSESSEEDSASKKCHPAEPRSPIWFAAGGILIGGAVGYALAYLTQRNT